MTIIRSSENLTNKDIFDFTIAGDTEKMQDARDIIKIDKYAIVKEDPEDVKEGADPKTVLVVRDAETGLLYGTVSETFIRTFIACIGCFGEDFKAFSVKTGTTKNGREFIDCKYEEV